MTKDDVLKMNFSEVKEHLLYFLSEAKGLHIESTITQMVIRANEIRERKSKEQKDYKLPRPLEAWYASRALDKDAFIKWFLDKENQSENPS
jgi:hypothetical protein